MKITPFRATAFAAMAALTLLGGATRASAFGIGINIGSPPPPVYEAPPPAPYHDAYYVQGHHEWHHDHWVWVHGYYVHRPYPGAVWVPGHYNHEGEWRPGHWR